MPLTASELEKLAGLRRRWEEARRDTRPADRGAAEEGVRMAYRAVGLPPPDIVWVEGPADVARMWDDSRLEERAGRSAKPSVVSSVLRDAEHRLAEEVAPGDVRQLRRQALPFILDPASRGVLEAVATAPGLSRARLTGLIRGLTRLFGRPRPSWRYASLVECGLSPHDAPPLHIYELLGDRPGMHEAVARLEGLMQVIGNAGWLVPFERVAVLSERHHVLKIDTAGRLHGAEGPALAWPDGFTHYAWKGVSVPPWMIERQELIELGRIEREPDLTLRHCMVDIFSPERFIRRGYAERVSEDDCGILWQHLWRRGGVWAAVEVINGTPEPDRTYKRYFLQVPGNLRSARQAVAWTYGLTEHEYRRLRLRT